MSIINSSRSAATVKHPQRQLAGAFAALFLLLLATVLLSRLPLGAFHPLVAFGIAGIKAIVVAWFFMDLRGSASMTRLVAVGAVAWVIFAVVAIAGDYSTRGWHTPNAPRLQEGIQIDSIDTQY